MILRVHPKQKGASKVGHRKFCLMYQAFSLQGQVARLQHWNFPNLVGLRPNEYVYLEPEVCGIVQYLGVALEFWYDCYP